MYWLLKSEPNHWSWEDQAREKTTKWDGVRNYQARNHMRAMELGDFCFFYHSTIKEPAIVGIVRVIKAYEPDPHGQNFGYVTVEYHESLMRPITLKQIRNEPGLSHLGLVKQSRLSVMPVTQKEWNVLIGMAQ